MTISLCMIVKNEEDTLAKCLDSVKETVDEIIIVDTGSKDKTKDIAARYTDLIYNFDWIDDFSAARNYSFSLASKDYIMWLDADDFLLPEDAKKLLDLKKIITDETDTVMMKYNTGFDQYGNVTFSYYRERLSKRSRGFKWKEPVHEYLETGGKIINAEICVTHAKQHPTPSGRNIKIYESIINCGKELSPRGMYYYARELNDYKRYDDAVRWFNVFLDTGEGWTEDNIAACLELAECYFTLDRPREAFMALTRSFMYDLPRAEICCRIGYYFKELYDYRLAAYWFKLTLTLKKPENNWGFIHHDCWGYIPSLECAVCFDKLGEYEKAAMYNDIAGLYKPESAAVLYNRQYFNGILKDKTTDCQI